MIGMMAIGAFMLIALLSFYSGDPSFLNSGAGGSIKNSGGRFGAELSGLLIGVFGDLAYLFPLLLIYRAIRVFREKLSPQWNWPMFTLRTIGFFLVMFAGSAIAHIHFSHAHFDISKMTKPLSAGGFIGEGLGHFSLNSFGLTGATLVLLASFLIGLTVFTDLSWFKLMDATGAWTLRAIEWLQQKYLQWRESKKEQEIFVQAKEERKQVLVKEEKKIVNRTPPKIEKPAPQVVKSERAEKERQKKLFDEPVTGELPPISLLDPPDQDKKRGYSEEALSGMSRLLEIKLKDFGVDAEVVAVMPGPVVTRFEIQPAAGVKVSRITNLAKDLARSLAVVSVRVVEVIPGKTVVGIEIPNEQRDMIRFSEVLASKDFDEALSPLSLALGKDIAGQPVVADLQKMPHLLVAGTTGSGKSVGLNAMLLSMLFKATPNELRLVMVDPKMLELSVYDGIPHLLTPVVTDMKDAANALRWCVAEMERRYKLMSKMGVRNLTGYNRKVKDAEKAGEPLKDPLFKPESLDDPTEIPLLTTLPLIVVVIDEFADMMMIVGKKVEELIARIAQKARAAGIHLILATQRPSVDVITGLIKANVPTRMAFQVSSRIDSRTILDQGGAEQLLGHGDMLYLPPGTSISVRVHGAFVSDEEVHRVCDDWRRRGEPEYIEGLLESNHEGGLLPSEMGAMGGGEEGDPESDPLYDQAVRFVTESRRASISSVQRRLKIGYNRAARLIEAMEMAGIVTAMQSNGSREVIAPPPPA